MRNLTLAVALLTAGCSIEPTVASKNTPSIVHLGHEDTVGARVACEHLEGIVGTPGERGRDPKCTSAINDAAFSIYEQVLRQCRYSDSVGTFCDRRRLIEEAVEEAFGNQVPSQLCQKIKERALELVTQADKTNN